MPSFSEPEEIASTSRPRLALSSLGNAPPALGMVMRCPTRSMAGGSSGWSPSVTMTLSIKASAASRIPLEQNDAWAVQRRYTGLEILAATGDAPHVSLTVVAS